jgi:hypothetical protein
MRILTLPYACEVREPRRDKEEAYGLRWWPAKGAEPMVKPKAREHMLVIAMLGALGNGDKQKAIAIDQESSNLNNIATHFGTIRSYLLAWADSDAPVCAARK